MQMWTVPRGGSSQSRVDTHLLPTIFHTTTAGDSVTSTFYHEFQLPVRSGQRCVASHDGSALTFLG